jgi:hypothetical protein
LDRPQYDKYFEVMDTFGIPGTRVYRDHPLWKKDPKTAVFPETLQYARAAGHAGPPDRRATETLTKFILVDMFAKSIQGMRPEDAVAWAAGEIRKIYGAREAWRWPSPSAVSERTEKAGRRQGRPGLFRPWCCTAHWRVVLRRARSPSPRSCWRLSAGRRAR